MLKETKARRYSVRDKRAGEAKIYRTDRFYNLKDSKKSAGYVKARGARDRDKYGVRATRRATGREHVGSMPGAKCRRGSSLRDPDHLAYTDCFVWVCCLPVGLGAVGDAHSGLLNLVDVLFPSSTCVLLCYQPPTCGHRLLVPRLNRSIVSSLTASSAYVFSHLRDR